MLPHYDRPRLHPRLSELHRPLDSRRRLLGSPEGNGIEVLTQFRKPYYRHEALRLTDTGFPETEAISREVCSLPIYPEMDDDDVDLRASRRCGAFTGRESRPDVAANAECEDAFGGISSR